MNLTNNAKKYIEENNVFYDLMDTDPEYIERVSNFMFDEVVNDDDLDDKSRNLGIMATLLGCQGIDLYKEMLPAFLKVLTPVEIKETLYQATDYLGIGRVYPFVNATNEVFDDIGITLPLASQSTTTMETRLEAGINKQVELFGPQMKEFYKGSRINRYLAANCFGDYYTRNGLDNKQREMITFCFLAAEGGCEPQLTSHAMANLGLGNTKEYLMNIIANNVPYIGYPRSLNAVACLNKAFEQMNK